MENKKATQYSVVILSKLGEIFEEDETILEEMGEGTNATDFIHALANIVPVHFYNQLTNEGLQMLEFNHLANRLCFQNASSVTKKQK